MEYWKKRSEKPMVTIELTDYNFLQDFFYKCQSEKVVIFDEHYKVFYSDQKDLKLINEFNKSTVILENKILDLNYEIAQIKKQSFIQKLKNLFK
jgi:hypothetical protein